MQHAPRHNHRWQRTLAWVCLLFASATAVPIAVSFMDEWGTGVVISRPKTRREPAAAISLVSGAIARVILPRDDPGGCTVGPTVADVVVSEFDEVPTWRARWRRSEAATEYAVPVWWSPLLFGGVGIVLRRAGGGLFTRRRSGARVVVTTAMLLVANAAAAAPACLNAVWSTLGKPHSGLQVSIEFGWCVARWEEALPATLDGQSLERVMLLQPSVYLVKRTAWGIDWGGKMGPDVRWWGFSIHVWWLNIAFGGALLWIGIRAYRRGRDPTACSACGYSLAGLTGSACPECGKKPK